MSKKIQPLEMQGDVSLRPITQIPTGATPIPRRPLALGEISGHGHLLLKGADMLEEGYDLFELNGKTFVAINHDGVALHHVKVKTKEFADHHPIKLPPGFYEVLLQDEFNPESDAFERVLD